MRRDEGVGGGSYEVPVFVCDERLSKYHLICFDSCKTMEAETEKK